MKHIERYAVQYKSKSQWLVIELVKLIIMSLVIGLLFFDSVAGGIPVFPLLYPVFVADKEKYIAKKEKCTLEEFELLTQEVSVWLKAGYSLENSLLQAFSNLEKRGAVLHIKKPLIRVVNGIKCSNDINFLLGKFAEEITLPQVAVFSQLIETAKIHGGNMVDIIKSINKSMEENRRLNLEIESVLSAKRLEGMIMVLMPFFMILYIRFTNKGYMEVMYQSMAGRLFMLVGLIMTAIAYMVTEKIVSGTRIR